jgi:UDP-glucose 4-epimerase
MTTMANDDERPVVVFGGAGFVGHHLVRRLADAGRRVVVLDDLSRGRRALLAPALETGRVRLVEGCVAAPGAARALLEAVRPATVFHLAAMHFIPQCVAAPTDTIRVNVLGTQSVLEALEVVPDARLVFVSTADVYAPGERPHREDDPIGPNNVYGLSKLIGEQLLALAGRTRPRPGRALAARLFNVYGPGETNPHVLPDLLAWVRRGEPPRLGNLEPLRDYVHVHDVVDALLGLAVYDGPADVFNVGTGVATSVATLVRTLGEALGRPLEAHQDPAKVRAVERMRLVADATRAAREFGWRPRVGLLDGLRDLVEAECATVPERKHAGAGGR